MTIQNAAALYTQSFGTRFESVEIPIISSRAPTSSDVNYPLGKRWVYRGNNVYELTNLTSSSTGLTATWQISSGLNGFPITPYVVGPASTSAGFTTIQSALNAANAAGGGVIYVQPGTYVENLTLYGNTEIVGVSGNSDSATSGNTVVISGVHVAPASGSFTFANIRLISATHIFSSTAAGTSELVLLDCSVQITNGFTFNLPNWTGPLVVYNVGEGSTNNGVVNNTGGAICFFVSATLGAGTGNTMLTSGPAILQEIDLDCPWQAATGTTIACDYNIFTQTITAANNSTGSFKNCTFNTGSNAAFTMSSSAAVNLIQCIINSSANPSISGAGAGVLTLYNISWINNAAIAGTLSLAGTSLTPTTNTSLSSGTLSIKSTTTNSGNNAGFLQAIVGGSTVYIPYFSNIAP